MFYFIIGLFVGFIVSSIVLSFMLKKKLNNNMKSIDDVLKMFNGDK